jgi:DNA repair protein RadC
MSNQMSFSFDQSVSSMASFRIIDELDQLIDSRSMAALSADQISKVFRIAERLAEYSISKLQDQLQNSEATKTLLCNRYRNYQHEVFGVIMLNNRHVVVGVEEVFRGTIDGCSVHPREVVKLALKHNAAAVVLFHNHPSGCIDPSRADIQMTRRLTESLSLVDVRVLDHVIVGASSVYSFAEKGVL